MKQLTVFASSEISDESYVDHSSAVNDSPVSFHSPSLIECQDLYKKQDKERCNFSV